MIESAVTVRLTDGRKFTTRKFGVADLVAFERQFGVSASSFESGQDLRLEWIVFLAWTRLHRSGDVADDFDSFLALIDDFEMAGSEEESVMDPTVPDPLPVS